MRLFDADQAIEAVAGSVRAHAERVLVDEDRQVGYARRRFGRFGASTNPQELLFDQHDLRIAFMIPKLQLRHVERNVVLGPRLGIDKELSLPDWTSSGARLDLAPDKLVECLPPVPTASF